MTDDNNFLHRTEILMGKAAVEKLANAEILLAGAGGVGGYAAEALVRGGIGSITVYDPDPVHISNINRQILALQNTCGKLKTEVLQERLRAINPDIKATLVPQSLTPENIKDVLQSKPFDYVVDAIDSLRDKCFLLAMCRQFDIPVISAMGAGCRLDPAQVRYSDISKTFNCKLAKNVRATLKKKYGITKGIRCVFSAEPPIANAVTAVAGGSRPAIGSSSYMPGIFGLFLAAAVINDIVKN